MGTKFAPVYATLSIGHLEVKLYETDFYLKRETATNSLLWGIMGRLYPLLYSIFFLLLNEQEKKKLLDCDCLFLLSVIVSNAAENIQINNKYLHIIHQKYHRVEYSTLQNIYKTRKLQEITITDYRILYCLFHAFLHQTNITHKTYYKSIYIKRP